MRRGLLPLTGLRIVDTTTFIAGPSATLALAQLGAEVIRVDPLGGASDSGRLPLAESGRSLYWTSLNRGKHSLCIDIRSEEGRQLLVDVITAPGEGGGIYVTNAVGRALLDYAELTTARGDVIMVQIQGMPDGRPAVDYTVTRDIGMANRADGSGRAVPLRQPVPAWDLLCGMHAGLAVLAAERQRRLTGSGQHVKIALWDVAVSALGSLGMLAEAQASVSPPRLADGFIYGTFGTDFLTADEASVMVVALTARMWEDLVSVTETVKTVGRLEDALGVDFREEGTRYEYRVLLAELMRPWFASREAADVAASLGQTRIQWSLGRSLDALVASLKVDQPDLVGMVEEPGVGRLLATKSPLRFSGTPRQAPSPSPQLGQHGAQLLKDLLHLDDATIGDLERRHVIGGVTDD